MRDKLQILRWIQSTTYVLKRPYGSKMPENLRQVLLKLDRTSLPSYDGVTYAE